MASYNSELLKHRYPYVPDPPLGQLEVSSAFGRRYFARLADIAAASDVSDDDRFAALCGIEERLGDPQAVAEVVSATDIVRTCADGLRQRWSASTPPRVLAKAASVLGRCAALHDGCVALRRHQAVAALAGTLAHNDAGVREACAAALARVSEGFGGPDLCLAGHGVQAVVSALRDQQGSDPGSSVVAAHALSACHNLACDAPARAALLQADAVGPVVELLSPREAGLRTVDAAPSFADPRDRGRIDPRVVLTALRTLAAVAADEAGRQACVEAGAVPAIVAVARDPITVDTPLPGDGPQMGGSQPVAALARRRRRAASAALCALAVDERVKAVLGGEEEAEAVMSLAADSDRATAESAAICARLAAELPATFQALVSALLAEPKLLVSVFGRHCASAVNACLTEQSLDQRRAAAETLAEIAQTEEGRHSIGQCLHCVRRLGLALAEEDAQTSEAAHQALARLLKHDKRGVEELRALIAEDEEGRLKRALAAFPQVASTLL